MKKIHYLVPMFKKHGVHLLKIHYVDEDSDMKIPRGILSGNSDNFLLYGNTKSSKMKLLSVITLQLHIRLFLLIRE